jgi:hypothetical protein
MLVYPTANPYKTSIVAFDIKKVPIDKLNNNRNGKKNPA